MEWCRNRLNAYNMNERLVTKKMLSKLREGMDKKAKEIQEEFKFTPKERDNFLTRSRILMEEVVNESVEENNEADSSHKNYFAIKKNTPQFGNVRVAQEELIRKTIGDNVTISDDALRYYPDSDDMTLDGAIPSLNIKFQFRYSDPSGSDGVYVWCEAMQMTEANVRTIGKLRNVFLNWRDGITQDGDLMERLKKSSRQD